ncbi:trypsin [Cooperia oncophora]
MRLAILFLVFRHASSLNLCDESPIEPLLRVIGGSAASAGDYPWQAAVVFYDGSNKGLMCGATVINEYWVLTAAHCIMENPRSALILTGLQSLRDPQHTYHAEKIVIHPGYDESTIANDIAVVKSKRSLLKNGVSPVCLNEKRPAPDLIQW